MAKQLDKIVVVDVESTCWQGEPPPEQESEIIEIGVCLLDVATVERELKHSILVRPERSTVSSFCTDLTTLTPEDVARGVPFAAACAKLQQEYKTSRRVWASYGDYDRRQFQRQCQTLDIPYPFNHTHINVKNLFAMTMGLRQEVSLAKAMELVGWSMEGIYHRGDDDAWNIARLLGELLKRGRTFAANGADQ